jgi:hypothetical protein
VSWLQLRRDGLHWIEADGEIVALDDRSMQYMSANSVGAVIWRALVDGSTRDALVARVVDEFEVDESTAGRDVDAFVADISKLGMLDG